MSVGVALEGATPMVCSKWLSIWNAMSMLVGVELAVKGDSLMVCERKAQYWYFARQTAFRPSTYN
jgi:hypothetical protein